MNILFRCRCWNRDYRMVRYALNCLIKTSNQNHKFKVQWKKSVQRILWNQEAMVGIVAFLRDLTFVSVFLFVTLGVFFSCFIKKEKQEQKSILIFLPLNNLSVPHVQRLFKLMGFSVLYIFDYRTRDVIMLTYNNSVFHWYPS